MVLQFGSQGDKDANYIVEIGEALVKRGFVVITVDMPGRGARSNNSPGPEDFEDLVRWYMDDYAHAVKYLAAHPKVDTRRIHFVGTSLGAITGIPFCAQNLRIKTCTAIVGGGAVHSSLPDDLDCVRSVGKIAPRSDMSGCGSTKDRKTPGSGDALPAAPVFQLSDR